MCLNRSLAFIFFSIIAVCPDPSASWEYCKPEIQQKLCGEKYKHTVCDPTRAFDEKETYNIAEKFLAHVPVTRKFTREILQMHNEFRNRVAGGSTTSRNSSENYPIASRMRELLWDTELMYVAHIHTKQVKMGHDYCRNTQRYLYSGQNLGVAVSDVPMTIMDFLKEEFENMYAEKNLIKDPVAMAAKYTSEYEQIDAGHFTQLMNDRVSRVGCAISVGSNCRTKDKTKVKKWCYYLSCNYDNRNIPGTPTYNTDKITAGSQCFEWEVGKSNVYKNLCANSGKYFDTKREIDSYLRVEAAATVPDETPPPSDPAE